MTARSIANASGQVMASVSARRTKAAIKLAAGSSLIAGAPAPATCNLPPAISCVVTARMIDRRGIAFTGSDSEASAIAFDKERAKDCVRDRGVKVAESRVVIPSVSEGPGGERAAQSPSVRLDASLSLTVTAREMLDRHQRIVAKPLGGGSSRGLFFLNRGETIPNIEVPYIVEPFIAGRELTVGVFDNAALPVIEIEIDSTRQFDYEGKYLGKGAREICPTKISDAMRDEVQRIGVIAHEAIGCDGCSRTDVIANDDGVWFLELNTLPGLTTSSLVPLALREAGITMREFIEREITSAVRRRSRAHRASR